MTAAQDAGAKLALPIRQQDGELRVLWIADTHHNRRLADYIKRHEPFTHEEGATHDQ